MGNRIHLIETYSALSNYFKPLILNESNKKVLCEGVEYPVTYGYEAPVWRLNSHNLNNRIYTLELAKKIVNENKVTVGLANHPSENSEQPDGDVEKICFVERDPFIRDMILWVKIFLVGPHGKQTIKDILDIPGGMVGLSSSAYGEVNRDLTVNVDTFELERYCDHVLQPSGSVYIFGSSEMTEKSIMNESFEIGKEVTFDGTKWIIQKNDGKNLSLRKANQDNIFKEIPIEEVELVNENKIDLKNDDKIKENIINESNRNYYNDGLYIDSGYYVIDIPTDKIIDGPYELYDQAQNEFSVWNKNQNIYIKYIDNRGFIMENIIKENEQEMNDKEKEDIKKNDDKKEEGKKPMNKKYSIEEKSVRLSITKLIEEAEKKQDIEEKLTAYSELLEWFEDGFSPDLKLQVDKKIGSINEQIKKLAKKGQKVDTLEEKSKKLDEANSELQDAYLNVSKKYEKTCEMLDNLKVMTNRSMNLYEHQKARANGLVSATQFKEALNAVELLNKKLIESNKIVNTLINEKMEISKKLNEVTKVLNEKIKFEEIKKLQKTVQKVFKEDVEADQKVKDEADKEKMNKENEIKKAEESLNIYGQKELIENYYNDLQKMNSNYIQYKSNILKQKTLMEAEVYVMSIKTKVEEKINLSQESEFNTRLKLKENFEKDKKAPITDIKQKKGWI